MADLSFWRRPRLLIPAVAGPMAETGILLALGARGAAALGPQVTAPPPFDVFHDLRWVSVYHNSWVGFVLEIALVLCLRSAYTAWLVQRAWPDQSEAPSMPAAFVRAIAFYAVAALLLVPWVVLMFGFAFSGLSWLYLAALPPMIAIALVIHRGALSHAAGNIWDWRPRRSSVAWVAAAFLWLSAAGALISDGPLPLGIAAAGAAGLLNARAAFSIAAGIADRRRPSPRRFRFAVPVALGAIFAVTIGGAVAGFAAADRPKPPPIPRRLPSHASGQPVLVVSGFNSRWVRAEAFPVPRGFTEWRYSYAGVGPLGRLLPYGPKDTLQPLDVSARRLAEQVALLHAAYDRPVTIVAESEGALVARYFLTELYRPGSSEVNRVALLDMPPFDPAIYYPARAQSDGWGIASGWGLRGLTEVIESLGPLEISADAPMLRELADCPALSARVVHEPAPPGVTEVSFLALGDAVDGTAGAPTGSPAYVVTAPHGGLIHDRSVRQGLWDMMTGRPIAPDLTRLDLVRFVSAVSNAWHAPGLLPGLGPAREC